MSRWHLVGGCVLLQRYSGVSAQSRPSGTPVPPLQAGGCPSERAAIWSLGRASNHLTRGQGPYGFLATLPCLLLISILTSSEVETGLQRKVSAREPETVVTLELFPVMDGFARWVGWTLVRETKDSDRTGDTRPPCEAGHLPVVRSPDGLRLLSVTGWGDAAVALGSVTPGAPLSHSTGRVGLHFLGFAAPRFNAKPFVWHY